MNGFNNYGASFSSICRTCLKVKEGMRPLSEANIADMLMYCSSIQVIHGDGMPHLICLQCLRQLTKFHTFKGVCTKSESKLKQYILHGFLPPEQSVQTIIATKEVEFVDSNLTEKYIQTGIMLSSLTEHDNLLTSADQLSAACLSAQQSDDDDPTGIGDCLELGLEPECNLVESALAALRRESQPGPGGDEEEEGGKAWTDLQTVDSTNKDGVGEDAKSGECSVVSSSLRSGGCVCGQCGSSFSCPGDLAVHMSTHPADGCIQCTICSKLFPRMRMLKRHIKIHMSKAHKCVICQKEFTEAGALKRHLKTHTGQSKDKAFTCVTCGKGYQDAHYLSIHVRKHTGERPFGCSLCPKSFSDPRLLASHAKTHNQDKAHPCTMCTKRFTHSSTLATHLRTHTGEKPYICKTCGKSFIQSSNLSLHMRTHTGARPYVCGVCRKGFASSSTLAYHARTHTGERHYLCSVCGKAFARSEDVTLHMRTHTGEKPYECSECNKKFTTSSHRNQHMLTHTGYKPHICKICSKGCISLSYLRQHMKTHFKAVPLQPAEQPAVQVTDSAGQTSDKAEEGNNSD